MNRLIEKDIQGNWGLKGIRWEQLHEGQVITGELWKKLYGALWKLMEYEDTGMTPEEIEKLHNEQDTNPLIFVAGCPLEVIQELMGHSKPETTQRYIAKSQARVVQSAARYFNAA